jgi:phosphohistidine phosphatase
MAEKNLHIVRHGKSSWEYEDISDIDRPLSTRGINNSYLMAKKLSRRKVQPGLLISSPANRALHTTIIFARVMKLPFEMIRIEDLIYTGQTEEMLDLVSRQDDAISEILIFGHNPAFTILANRLMPDNVENIPTAGIVSLTFETDSWADICRMTASKDFFDYPRRYS